MTVRSRATTCQHTFCRPHPHTALVLADLLLMPLSRRRAQQRPKQSWQRCAMLPRLRLWKRPRRMRRPQARRRARRRPKRPLQKPGPRQGRRWPAPSLPTSSCLPALACTTHAPGVNLEPLCIVDRLACKGQAHAHAVHRGSSELVCWGSRSMHLGKPRKLLSAPGNLLCGVCMCRIKSVGAVDLD